MSKRLQVVVEDSEFGRFQRAARARGLTLATWVRQALRVAEAQGSSGDLDSKLAAVRAASGYAFPAPDIDVMLAEIERGYVVPDGS